MAYQTPSPAKKTTTTGTNLTKAERILDLYRLFVDRNKPLPSALRTLVQSVTIPRQGDVTPKSRKIQLAKELNKLSEDMELYILANKFVYRAKWYGENDMKGESLIWQGRNDQWSDRIPRPPDALPASALAAALEQLGLPKKLKPDMSFGYGNDAFPGSLYAAMDALPADLLVFPKAPWFPYMVVQWKSGLGTVREAEQQVRRDAAAAIDTIYRFFQHAHPDQEPSHANTCMFSLIVYMRHCEYRLHWRRVDDDDATVSYEGDVISQAFFNDVDMVFKTRGVILKTLDWVRGTRLTAIRVALQALRSRPAVQQASSPTTDAAQINASNIHNFQSTTQQEPIHTHRPLVAMPHTPPLTSVQNPQSRGSRARPEKRRKMIHDDSSADSDDPLQR
ncbi:MAG: hypothetical protein LQ341_005599 [Variospora aurantia]|nr:MAG: hypothetical protein LQ341_005599 [Variospora aurantia]